MRVRLFSVPFLSLTAFVSAQDYSSGSIGSFYQGLYLNTHLPMVTARMMGGGARGRVRRTSYVTRFNPTPSRSGAIERMVARVPAASRADVRRRLVAIQAKFPQVMRAAGQQVGVTLRPGDLRDVESVAGVGAFQELRGTTLTNAQFKDELRGTYHNYAAATGGTRATTQREGETYEMAILLMGVLKEEARRPGNPEAAQDARWLRGLAQETLLKAYSTRDASTLTVGAKGIERAHK